MHLFERRGEPVEKLPLRFQVDDKVAPGAEHQGRRLDGAGIGHQALRRIVQIEQHVDRDLAKNQRIGFVARGLRRIVRQHFCPHVTLHLTGAEKLVLQA